MTPHYTLSSPSITMSNPTEAIIAALNHIFDHLPHGLKKISEIFIMRFNVLMSTSPMLPNKPETPSMIIKTLSMSLRAIFVYHSLLTISIQSCMKEMPMNTNHNLSSHRLHHLTFLNPQSLPNLHHLIFPEAQPLSLKHQYMTYPTGHHSLKSNHLVHLTIMRDNL